MARAGWAALAALGWACAGVLAWGAVGPPGLAPEEDGEAQVLRAMRQGRKGREGDTQVARAIVRESGRQGLDPLLVAAVIHRESGFQPTARSRAGALGLMQLMPSTGAHLLAARGVRGRGEAHLLDVDLNVELGTSYLRTLLVRFGSMEEALAAYNHGPAAARRLLRDGARRERMLAGYPGRVMETYARFRQQNRSQTR